MYLVQQHCAKRDAVFQQETMGLTLQTFSLSRSYMKKHSDCSILVRLAEAGPSCLCCVII